MSMSLLCVLGNVGKDRANQPVAHMQLRHCTLQCEFFDALSLLHPAGRSTFFFRLFFPSERAMACQAWIPAAPNHKLSAPRLGGEPGQKPTEKAFLAAHGLVSQKTATTEHRVTKAKG